MRLWEVLALRSETDDEQHRLEMAHQVDGCLSVNWSRVGSGVTGAACWGEDG